MLNLPKGLIVNPATRDEAVIKVQPRVGELLTKVVWHRRVGELVFWGRPVLSDQRKPTGGCGSAC
ncbi:MAG: hypothetical protein IPK78_19075 [Rhodospirillales bacterium]|nr:hypothetical protein [Rhodospirillales bacterium]